MSLSQKNFYRLAQEKLDQNQVVEAIKLLEEGLSQGYDHKLAMLLCKLYLDTEEVDLITANIINERNPVCYGSDFR